MNKNDKTLSQITGKYLGENEVLINTQFILSGYLSALKFVLDSVKDHPDLPFFRLIDIITTAIEQRGVEYFYTRNKIDDIEYFLKENTVFEIDFHFIGGFCV